MDFQNTLPFIFKQKIKANAAVNSVSNITVLQACSNIACSDNIIIQRNRNNKKQACNNNITILQVCIYWRRIWDSEMQATSHSVENGKIRTGLFILRAIAKRFLGKAACRYQLKWDATRTDQPNAAMKLG